LSMRGVVDNITGSGILQLRKLESLHSLELTRCSMDDRALLYLSSFQSLRKLSLSDSQFIACEGGFSKFKLTSLDLSGCAIFVTDGLLSTLPGTLEHLDISGCWHVTNRGLYYVGLLPKLSSLVIAHCGRISDAGMEFLSKLQLSYLDMSYCHLVTRATVCDRLRRCSKPRHDLWSSKWQLVNSNVDRV
jgi:hypothetical protein